VTYEGHYPGCTSHPDHEGDCTVARSHPGLAEQLESVGKIRLEALGLLDRSTNAIANGQATLDRLHACEMTMHDVAKTLAIIADEWDTLLEPMKPFIASIEPNPNYLTFTLPDRLRVLVRALLAKS